MPDASPMPIFDGHNDVLLRLIRKGAADVERHFIDGDGEGHLDLPRMTAGGFAGGLLAVFLPSPSSEPGADTFDPPAEPREAMAGPDRETAREGEGHGKGSTCGGAA